MESPEEKLQSLAAGKQRRLETLMAKNNQGNLTCIERQELQSLVRESEELMLDNARQLAAQRRQSRSR